MIKNKKQSRKHERTKTRNLRQTEFRLWWDYITQEPAACLLPSLRAMFKVNNHRTHFHSIFDSPQVDKCLLACGELDVRSTFANAMARHVFDVHFYLTFPCLGVAEGEDGCLFRVFVLSCFRDKKLN